MALSWLHHFPSWLDVSIPVRWCNGHHWRPFWLWWSVISGLLLLSQGCVIFPFWSQREAQSSPHSFLRQVQGWSLHIKKTPVGCRERSSCIQPLVLLFSRKKDQKEKQREKILFGYNLCLQFSTSVLFMNAPKTRQQQWLIQYAPCRKTIRKKKKGF